MTGVPLIRTQEDLEKDVQKAQAEILPILHKFKVDLSAQAFIDTNGTIKARPVWVPLKEDEETTISPTEKSS